MNQDFINVKVDREERPDLDDIYQKSAQVFLGRGGGWPLTMFLTPDQEPFYGGTYFPPAPRSACCCVRRLGQKTSPIKSRCSYSSKPWQLEGSTIISAAGSTATRWMASG